MIEEFCLFIGGSQDGKWLKVPTFHDVLFRELDPVKYVSPHAVNLKEHVYQKEILIAGEKRFTIYRFSKLTIEETMQKLIDGYKPRSANGKTIL